MKPKGKQAAVELGQVQPYLGLRYRQVRIAPVQTRNMVK